MTNGMHNCVLILIIDSSFILVILIIKLSGKCCIKLGNVFKQVLFLSRYCLGTVYKQVLLKGKSSSRQRSTGPLPIIHNIIYTHIYTFTYIPIHIYIYTFTYIHIYLYIYTHTHIYKYVHTTSFLHESLLLIFDSIAPVIYIARHFSTLY